MIAARRPRRWPVGRTLRVNAVVFLVIGAAVAAHHVTVATTTPETRTLVLDGPPACREIADAVQHERALTMELDEAAALVAEISAGLPDVVLSSDGDEIIAEAKALDEAKRDAQALELDLAAAQNTTSAVVGDCAPERAR